MRKFINKIWLYLFGFELWPAATVKHIDAEIPTRPDTTYIANFPAIEIVDTRLISEQMLLDTMINTFKQEHKKKTPEQRQKFAEGIMHITRSINDHQMLDETYIAYTLATVWHETNKTFAPVEEAYFLGEPKASNYRKKLKYYPYHGRGYSQLTHKVNYQLFSKRLKIDLVNNPDNAMDPAIAAEVLIIGMTKGFWKGAPVLSRYFTPDYNNWIGARRIVNGLDKAGIIADYALRIYSEMTKI